jgi:putative phosphoribosyl transferase
MMFHDRVEAGRLLAHRLRHLRGTDTVVVGLPRGGVPVAYEVAQSLDAPLDVIVVRKVGVPWQPELAMGAVGEGGVTIVDSGVVAVTGVDPDELAQAQARAGSELNQQVKTLRGGRPRVALDGRTAVVIDDGIATGSTARAACQVARAFGAARVVLAVPVAPADVVSSFSDVADEVVCLHQPTRFQAVGQFYDDFTPTTDGEVTALLDRAAAARHGSPVSTAAGDPPWVDEDVAVTAGGLELTGQLTVPPGARGLVVFAHGSGSSRHSPRNRYVARILHQARLGTLLFDLLTADEEIDRTNVFDIDLLAGRLRDVVDWVRRQQGVAGLPIGLFGASTGAATALWAAADPRMDVAAIVSRGGRPDLAGPRLSEVRAPTLLIVGGDDDLVLELNRQAQLHLRCPSQLGVVPGAGHLFEEPGTLHAAATLAARWFGYYLAARLRTAPADSGMSGSRAFSRLPGTSVPVARPDRERTASRGRRRASAPGTGVIRRGGRPR